MYRLSVTENVTVKCLFIKEIYTVCLLQYEMNIAVGQTRHAVRTHNVLLPSGIRSKNFL